MCEAPGVQGSECEALGVYEYKSSLRAGPHGPGISCMLMVVIPNSCLPLTWPNPQPYVHSHRTLIHNSQPGKAAAGVPWGCS